MFARFDAGAEVWGPAWRAAAELDCLVSLAVVSGAGTEDRPMVRPQFIEDGRSGVLALEQARHPCVAQALGRRRPAPQTRARASR